MTSGHQYCLTGIKVAVAEICQDILHQSYKGEALCIIWRYTIQHPNIYTTNFKPIWTLIMYKLLRAVQVESATFRDEIMSDLEL